METNPTTATTAADLTAAEALVLPLLDFWAGTDEVELADKLAGEMIAEASILPALEGLVAKGLATTRKGAYWAAEA